MLGGTKMPACSIFPITSHVSMAMPRQGASDPSRQVPIFPAKTKAISAVLSALGGMMRCVRENMTLKVPIAWPNGPVWRFRRHLGCRRKPIASLNLAIRLSASRIELAFLIAWSTARQRWFRSPPIFTCISSSHGATMICRRVHWSCKAGPLPVSSKDELFRPRPQWISATEQEPAAKFCRFDAAGRCGQTSRNASRFAAVRAG